MIEANDNLTKFCILIDGVVRAFPSRRQLQKIANGDFRSIRGIILDSTRKRLSLEARLIILRIEAQTRDYIIPRHFQSLINNFERTIDKLSPLSLDHLGATFWYRGGYHIIIGSNCGHCKGQIATIELLSNTQHRFPVDAFRITSNKPQLVDGFQKTTMIKTHRVPM